MNSKEVNYLIWRYLQESGKTSTILFFIIKKIGFEHTTFTFQHESSAHLADTSWAREVSAGALINVLQKGLQYMEVEAHVDKNGSMRRCVLPFSLIGRHFCENNETVLPETLGDSDLHGREKQALSNSLDEGVHRMEQKDLNISIEVNEVDGSKEIKELNESSETKEQTRTMGETKSFGLPELAGEMGHVDLLKSGVSLPDSSWPIRKIEKVTLLRGHKKNIFIGAWNPVHLNVVATASADATVRIWDLSEKNHMYDLLASVVLNAVPCLSESKDITSISWDNSGNYIAAGSYDGQVRIWNLDGTLKYLLTAHHGPIMAIKWNSKDSLLLTASCDSFVIAWNMFDGTLKHVYDKRPCAVMDVEWISDEAFASSGKDGSLDYWSIEKVELLRRWEGHSKEINSIKFNSCNNLLLSCSDDFTVKIWSLDISSPQKIFLGHSKSVISVQWKPQQKNDKTIIFASCSLDGTIKIWNTTQSSPLHSLSHNWAFFTISFNPSGDILAAGTKDGSVILYDVKEGYLFAEYNKTSDKDSNKNSVIEQVFDISWSKKGDQIIVCRANCNAEVICWDQVVNSLL
ncbi:uncharacterized protein T551_02813 [Pneumocystis jirovecii RU7]|uniref:Uncharacterized protein n=1 Tax=Pneumocystis jirovecii (strain RU7) TaxID=1408657 RepID=A0A0W4ZHK2_PNEJ7|nr:uncharacterized protein T551_02813 [Pneumocystis jirovecii RU7]KTW27846.1 hypothetical protein T551_02813 [Pneumocystis jirovecii RU7]